ncbi:hypothetical protein D3C78_1797670 [compost metagenome]
MLVAEKDTVTPSDIAISAYNRALEPKRLFVVPGANFEPYVKYANLAKQEALNWFNRHLKQYTSEVAFYATYN